MNINNIINKYDEYINNLHFHSSIKILDNERIVIESCKSINIVSENEIRLNLVKNILTIVGLNLKMCNYNKSGIIINGIIHSLSFEEYGRKEK